MCKLKINGAIWWEAISQNSKFLSNSCACLQKKCFMYNAMYILHASYKPISKQTRKSSGDEIANLNFFYYDILHALPNTINSCINSATDRRGYVLVRRFTNFSEITQCYGHYAVQGHSRSPILVPIESSYTTSC